MSNPQDRPESWSGEKDGVKGTFHRVTRRGGPGGYPWTETYFVPDSAAGSVDTRYLNQARDPRDLPGSQKVD